MALFALDIKITHLNKGQNRFVIGHSIHQQVGSTRRIKAHQEHVKVWGGNRILLLKLIPQEYFFY